MPPTLLPGPGHGSVEHFYHFLIGYFAPVACWLADHEEPEVVVRECGPLTPWFSLLEPFAKITVRPIAEVDRSDDAVVLPRCDRASEFPGAVVQRFARLVLDVRHERSAGGPGASEPQITVVDRGAPDPFYASGAAEIATAAAERRSIPNIADVAAPLRDIGTVDVVDFAALPPGDQVDLAARTTVLVGQHGAGLANVVWMPAGSAVVEILPPVATRSIPLFRALSLALGLEHRAVLQAGPHAPVDPARVRSAVADVLPAIGSTG